MPNSEDWLKEYIDSNSCLPSVNDCLWSAPDSYEALTLVGNRIIEDLRESFNVSTCLTLLDISILLKKKEYFTLGLTLCTLNEINNKWIKYYAFEYARLVLTDRDDICRIAIEVLEAFDKDTPEHIERSILQEIWSREGSLNKIPSSLRDNLRLPGRSSNQILMEPTFIQGNSMDRGEFMMHTEYIDDAITFYQKTPPSIRLPFFTWSDPSGFDRDRVKAIESRLETSIKQKNGFSLIRLGDGEGLFLQGKRLDLGGATSNGKKKCESMLDSNYSLNEPAYSSLLELFLSAVMNADVVGIPDVAQCILGPKDYQALASALLNLDKQQLTKPLLNSILPGGSHLHNYLLYSGTFSRSVFIRPRAIIGASVPRWLEKESGIVFLQIPGEKKFRDQEAMDWAHYPYEFEKVIDWIRNHIAPGDLVYVGGGILGKIYCNEIKNNNGIAIDVGSTLDLASGLTGTRGEYRIHPFMRDIAFERFCAC